MKIFIKLVVSIYYLLFIFIMIMNYLGLFHFILVLDGYYKAKTGNMLVLHSPTMYLELFSANISLWGFVVFVLGGCMLAYKRFVSWYSHTALCLIYIAGFITTIICISLYNEIFNYEIQWGIVLLYAIVALALLIPVAYIPSNKANQASLLEICAKEKDE